MSDVHPSILDRNIYPEHGISLVVFWSGRWYFFICPQWEDEFLLPGWIVGSCPGGRDGDDGDDGGDEGDGNDGDGGGGGAFGPTGLMGDAVEQPAFKRLRWH